MIKNNLQKEINKAMKAGDEVRVSTLKMLSSALTNAEIEKGREELTEDEELKVVQKEAKKRKDAIELYEKGGAEDKAERESKELKVLEEYLPEQLSESELVKLVDQAIEETEAESVKDMGKVIGFVMGKAKGRADGNKVAEVAKTKLNK